LTKACTFLLALDGVRRRPVGLLPFGPFVIYVIISSLVGCLYWKIPEDVAFFYGRGRAAVSMFNFGMLVLSTMSLASAFAVPGGGRILWLALRWLGVVHGVLSIYQYWAITLGWPLLGISRPHGLTLEGRVADVAVFVSATGAEILRPGGLAGEPKAAAVIFGTVLFCALHAGYGLDRNRRERLLTTCAALLSFVGFVAALSTSAFVGLGAALILSLFLSRGRYLSTVILLGSFLTLAAVGLARWFDWSLGDLLTVASERTIERLTGAPDAPVAAALEAIRSSLPIALFGVGEGGSTFIVMEYLGQSFEYAYAPNIGFVRMFSENGLAGVLLFGTAYGILTMRSLRRVRAVADRYRALFVSASISSLCLFMTGSGSHLGLALAASTMYAAQADWLTQSELVDNQANQLRILRPRMG
jgi:hypothetical protein